MTWRRIKCASCGFKVTIESTELLDILRTQQRVNCCVENCPGEMRALGPVIVRPSTVRRGATYDFQINRQKIRRPRPAQYQVDDDDGGDEDGSRRKRAKVDEDMDYAPSEEYTPSMRFTTVDMETGLRQIAPRGLTIKTTGRLPIKAAVPGEREKSTSAQMNNQPAWSYAQSCGAPNANAFQLGGQGHYEWCHMQGVSLGGYTMRANLVAGHYAVNTYMSVIEEYLRGKTAYQIEVIAYCQHDNVADFISYKIHRILDGSLAMELAIDGSMKFFSANDRDRVRDAMKRNNL